MTRMSRRRLLQLAGGTLAAAPRVGAQPLQLYRGPVKFLHGVASGDPGLNDVIVWTRVTPEDSRPAGDIMVQLEVSRTASFERVDRIELTRAEQDRDYTVKYHLSGLSSGQDYFYRFRCDDALSSIGRTRTLPQGKVSELKLAIASCALWSGGYFNAYEAIARHTDLDAIVHLGDYIYEYGAAPSDYGMHIGQKLSRIPEPPHLLVSLDDYRQRHAQYKTDEQLQQAHASAPWIAIWDDHEVANDIWHSGAAAIDPADTESWQLRRAAALRAYYEWMPVREPASGSFAAAAARAFRFGDLGELFMIETRLTGRDQQLSYEEDLSWDADTPQLDTFREQLNDPSRHMLGEWQEAWLAQQLRQSVDSGVAWQILGNQVLLARVAAPDVRGSMPQSEWESLLASLPERSRQRVERNDLFTQFDIPSNLDSWDGYPAARSRLYSMVEQAGASLVALAGDTHMFWANELFVQPGGRRIGAEFATSSITSPSYGDYLPGAPIGRAFVSRNPEVRFNDPAAKGYVLLSVTPDLVTADYRSVSTVQSREFVETSLGVFSSTHPSLGDTGECAAICVQTAEDQGRQRQLQRLRSNS